MAMNSRRFICWTRKLTRRESRVLIRSVPDWGPLAARLVAHLLARRWLVRSARPLGPPWAVWPELRLDTRSLKRTIRHERRVLSRLLPEWEPLAARLPAPWLAQPWVAQSARWREPPLEA